MILAVDPGASGGLAWTLSSAVPDVGCAGMPKTPEEVFDFIRTIWVAARGDLICYVEDVPKYIGVNLPGSSMAVLFFNVGLIRGILTALGADVRLVNPHEWQKSFNVGTRRAAGSHSKWKQVLAAEAKRQFPQLGKKVTLKTADALLILQYGLRISRPAGA